MHLASHWHQSEIDRLHTMFLVCVALFDYNAWIHAYLVDILIFKQVFYVVKMEILTGVQVL